MSGAGASTISRVRSVGVVAGTQRRWPVTGERGRPPDTTTNRILAENRAPPLVAPVTAAER